MSIPPTRGGVGSPENDRLDTMSDEKILLNTVSIKKFLIAIKNIAARQIHALTSLSGKMAGLAELFPIMRLRYSKSWWSVGPNGSTRTSKVEGS
jgi:hypothetical protein